ncbi:MAG: type II toxin-antitoxin system Phd/YefM family antitoxin [Phycisphaerales bacterium]|nr:type II toxin-antitoxin system Phd/YefM family antitoxin [Phycisphaerales bacterium]
MEWKLAGAKSRLSELVNRVLTEGPQFIRRRNDAVVVVSERDYRRWTGAQPTLKALILEGPSLEGLDVGRDASPMRDVEL